MEIEKKKTNKVKIFGKSIPILVLVLLGVGLVSGALVGFLSNPVTADIEVKSPILLVGTEFELEIEYGGEDGFVLIKITNLADVDTTGDFEIAVSDTEGPLSDMEGIAIAVGEDINYCFKQKLGEPLSSNMTGVTDCEIDYLVWIENNIEWYDWYGNTDYSKELYPSPLVINHGGNSFQSVDGYVDNKLILPDMTIPAREIVYGVIYVATDVALTPATYTFNMTFVP